MTSNKRARSSIHKYLELSNPKSVKGVSESLSSLLNIKQPLHLYIIRPSLTEEIHKDYKPKMTSPKLALITGATGGIGAATAIALAKTGDFNLALHYNSASKEKQDQVLKAIKDASSGNEVKAVFYQADIGNYDSVRQLHSAVVADLGHPDVLFNNAGTNAGIKAPASLSDVSIDVIETTWRVNTGSGILLTQLCLPHMESQGWGRIIFDSSVAAFTGGYVGPHYASSKSAQHGFVHWLAGNVAKKGITVNAVAPALIGGTVMMDQNGDEEGLRRVAQSMSCLIASLVWWRGVLMLCLQTYPLAAWEGRRRLLRRWCGWLGMGMLRIR